MNVRNILFLKKSTELQNIKTKYCDILVYWLFLTPLIYTVCMCIYIVNAPELCPHYCCVLNHHLLRVSFWGYTNAPTPAWKMYYTPCGVSWFCPGRRLLKDVVPGGLNSVLDPPLLILLVRLPNPEALWDQHAVCRLTPITPWRKLI